PNNLFPPRTTHRDVQHLRPFPRRNGHARCRKQPAGCCVPRKNARHVPRTGKSGILAATRTAHGLSASHLSEEQKKSLFFSGFRASDVPDNLSRTFLTSPVARRL